MLGYCKLETFLHHPCAGKPRPGCARRWHASDRSPPLSELKSPLRIALRVAIGQTPSLTKRKHRADQSRWLSERDPALLRAGRIRASRLPDPPILLSLTLCWGRAPDRNPQTIAFETNSSFTLDQLSSLPTLKNMRVTSLKHHVLNHELLSVDLDPANLHAVERIHELLHAFGRQIRRVLDCSTVSIVEDDFARLRLAGESQQSRGKGTKRYTSRRDERNNDRWVKNTEVFLEFTERKLYTGFRPICLVRQSLDKFAARHSLRDDENLHSVAPYSPGATGPDAPAPMNYN